MCTEIIDLNQIVTLVLHVSWYLIYFDFQVVKELLVKETGISSDLLSSDAEWCREEELPEETRCKVNKKNLIFVSMLLFSCHVPWRAFPWPLQSKYWPWMGLVFVGALQKAFLCSIILLSWTRLSPLSIPGSE